MSAGCGSAVLNKQATSFGMQVQLGTLADETLMVLLRNTGGPVSAAGVQTLQRMRQLLADIAADLPPRFSSAIRFAPRLMEVAEVRQIFWPGEVPAGLDAGSFLIDLLRQLRRDLQAVEDGTATPTQRQLLQQTFERVGSITLSLMQQRNPSGVL